MFLLGLANLVVCSGLGFQMYVEAQVQENYQEISANLDGDVLVFIDNDGVPRIKASSLSDLFFAQGYVQARDRLFQCDILRKVASGTIASLLGDEYLDSDYFIHSIGIPEIARESIYKTRDEVLDLCQRYIDGVNHYLDNSINNLPMEYDLLKIMGLPLTYTPEEFTVEDVLCVLLYFSFQFSSNFGFNLGLEDFIKSIGVDAFQEFSRYLKINGEYNITEDDFITSNKSLILPLGNFTKINSMGLISSKFFGDFKGSNSWVVSGARTTSGKPIIANDPHLVIGNPGIMKSWQLECEENGLKLIGAQLPLLPGIILGRNKDISWGVTAPFFDCGDAWRIQLNPEGTHYLYNGTYHPINEKTVNVYSNDGKAHPYTIKKIPGHGVLLDMFGELLSFRWSAMIDTDPICNGSNMLNAFFDLFYSSSVDDILAISNPEEGWDEFPLNVLYATKSGDIGYFGMGKLPVRRNTRVQGAIPLNGSAVNDSWERWITQDEIPRCLNPASGMLYTANTKIDFPLDNSTLPYISSGWGDAYRAKRIRELLVNCTNSTMEDSRQIQGDLKDFWAPILLPLVLDELNKNNDYSEIQADAIEYLNVWGYSYGKNEIGASLYRAFLEEFRYNLLGDDLNLIKGIESDSASQVTFKFFTFDEILTNLTLDYNTSSIVKDLFDHKNTPETENITDIIQASFIDAINELISNHGQDINAWTWKKVNPLLLKHPFSKGDDLMGFLNVGPLEADGGSCIRLQKAGEGAATRFICEWQDTPLTSLVTPPGPSGNYFSPYRQTEMQLYLSNSLKYFPDDFQSIQGSNSFELILKLY
ncbi:MAG: penicillin acylase family protein [Candidatus Hodarchaeota archaeon]